MILLKNLHELLTLGFSSPEASSRLQVNEEMQQLAILHQAVIDEGVILAVGKFVRSRRNMIRGLGRSTTVTESLLRT